MESFNRNIPFFDYSATFSCNETDYLHILKDVLTRGAYIMQKDLQNFENNLANYVGVKHAIGTADGTMALMMSLLAIGIGKGSEVILPSHTFVATAAAVHHVGAKPVLADIWSDHLIDPDSVESLITSKTRAIIPVQLNGRTADMDRLISITDKYNILIIEDACQGLGALYKGKAAGSFGLAGAFSFYPSKTLGCFGDGGALVTDDDSVAEQVRLLRDHGRDRLGNVRCFGFNARLDNIQAAILNYKLKNYQEVVERRRAIARLYKERLGYVEQLNLPPGPDNDSDHFDVYQNYEIEAEDRDNLRDYLEKHGVGTLIQWGGKAIHQFRSLNLGEIHLPKTDNLFKKAMMLPIYPNLANSELDYICETIRNFYKKF